MRNSVGQVGKECVHTRRGGTPVAARRLCVPAPAGGRSAATVTGCYARCKAFSRRNGAGANSEGYMPYPSRRPPSGPGSPRGSSKVRWAPVVSPQRGAARLGLVRRRVGRQRQAPAMISLRSGACVGPLGANLSELFYPIRLAPRRFLVVREALQRCGARLRWRGSLGRRSVVPSWQLYLNETKVRPDH